MGGNRGSKGGHGGVEGQGGGEKPESQKARTGAGVGRRGEVVGREGLRVREHNTRQLIAPVVFFCFVFFYSTLKGGLAVDLFKKGIWFGKCTSTIYQSLCKLYSCLFFLGSRLVPSRHSSEQQLLHLDFLPTTQHEGVAALRQISKKACGSTSLSSRQCN